MSIKMPDFIFLCLGTTHLLRRLMRDLVESDLALGLYGVFALFDIEPDDVVDAIVVLMGVTQFIGVDTLQICFILFGVVFKGVVDGTTEVGLTLTKPVIYRIIKMIFE